MFKFSLSYKDLDYHIKGDPPFTFPPDYCDEEIEANIIEIRGKNGTGKTTLLNVLALALGYLNYGTELENKEDLVYTLNELDNNNTLEYNFLISSDVGKEYVLELSKKKGKRSIIKVNGSEKSIDALNNFEIIFLTEDDPEKVVNQSIRKVVKYFKNIEQNFEEITKKLMEEGFKIDDYETVNNSIKSVEDKITDLKKETSEKEKQLKEKEELLNNVLLRNDLKEKLDILASKEDTIKKYEKYREDYEKYQDSTYDEISKKINQEQKKLDKLNFKINNTIDLKIIENCRIIKLYGVKPDVEKILGCDKGEIENIKSNIDIEESKTSSIKYELVDDMIDLFSSYSPREIIPIINKSVSETVSELREIKNKMNFDRIYILVEELKNLINDKNGELRKSKRIREKIDALYDKLEAHENIDVKNLLKNYRTYEAEYIKLQNVMSMNKDTLLDKWHKLSKIKNEQKDVESEISNLKLEIRLSKQNTRSLEKNLKVLNEKKGKKPKYYEYKDSVSKTFENIIKIRERIINYVSILEDTKEAKRQYENKKDKEGFTSKDYKHFYNSVGKYLGKLFEPVKFANETHTIDFFDIEDNKFVTSKNRKIQIRKLSEGQNKITALTPSLKRLGLTRKGIVLIDEIADLDYENIADVKRNLKQAYQDGRILLAIMVRPLHQEAENSVEIIGW
ncbi:MAG: hypothetical protein ACTSRS_21430 [Candidatus Helarchaeota archaeon]